MGRPRDHARPELRGGSRAWPPAAADIGSCGLYKAQPLAELDSSFFRVRFDRLTPAEKRHLRAMAELGAGPHRSGKGAKVLAESVTGVAPVRSALLRKGMIFSQAHGGTEFTVPLFDGFMKRAILQLA